MVDETRRQEPVPGGITPARARAEAEAGTTATRRPIVEIATREAGDTSRTSPRMRFDVLQIAAWVTGIYLVVVGLVAIARAGLSDLAVLEPVVTVGDLPFTPLYAGIFALLGVMVLTSGTGEVNERALRVGGVLFAIAGAVLLIEPSAFTEFLGVGEGDGTILLGIGALLAVASFVPPLSIARPGVRRS